MLVQVNHQINVFAKQKKQRVEDLHYVFGLIQGIILFSTNMTAPEKVTNAGCETMPAKNHEHHDWIIPISIETNKIIVNITHMT